MSYKRHTIIAQTPLGRRLPNGGHALVPVFLTVEWDGKRLSMSGVEGPERDGHAWGSCGQIDMHPWGYVATPGIDLGRIRAVWGAWHLNDMRAGTVAQTLALRDMPAAVYPESHYDKACAYLASKGLNPDNGYAYGSRWLHEDVPADVVDFLQSLPDDGAKYPWHD